MILLRGRFLRVRLLLVWILFVRLLSAGGMAGRRIDAELYFRVFAQVLQTRVFDVPAKVCANPLEKESIWGTDGKAVSVEIEPSRRTEPQFEPAAADLLGQRSSQG